jgi:hypothetical protein
MNTAGRHNRPAINPDHLSDRRMRQEFLTGPFLDLITHKVNDKLAAEAAASAVKPTEANLTYSLGQQFAAEFRKLTLA